MIFTFVWKLLVSALAFVLGLMLGGMLATMLGLAAPVLPPTVDAGSAGLIMFATSPLLVLALYFVNRELAGGWLARSAMLFLLTWVAYSVNNVIEATIFSNYETAPWFSIVNFLPAVLFCTTVTAWLFPSRGDDRTLRTVWQDHMRRHSPPAWTVRLLAAALIFAPIYYAFGLLVVPFVGDYYQRGDFGLMAPPLGTLLLVLLVRSCLFFVAALPIVFAWQGSRRNLILRLGFAFFVLVGLLYMLAASWIAPHVRLAHTLEILADSFVYAAALVWLLSGGHVEPHAHSSSGLSWQESRIG